VQSRRGIRAHDDGGSDRLEPSAIRAHALGQDDHHRQAHVVEQLPDRFQVGRVGVGTQVQDDSPSPLVAGAEMARLLDRSARNGHEDVAAALVKGGADPKLANGDGLTATMVAIVNDWFDLAGKLIDLGADPNDGSLYFATDMHDGTTDMRQRDGGLLRWDHPNKLTALDLMKKLIAMGADPNKPFVGMAFKIVEDECGQLTFTRIYQGKIEKGGSYFKPSSSWWYVQSGPRELHYRQYLLRVSQGFERNATVGFRCVKDAE